MIVEKTHILIYTIVKENLDFEEKKMVIYQCNLWVVDDFKYLKKKIHLTKLVFATNELKNQIPYFCIIYFAYSRVSVVDPWINK
jgi:hypothetical protein